MAEHRYFPVPLSAPDNGKNRDLGPAMKIRMSVLLAIVLVLLAGGGGRTIQADIAQFKG
jgi:hypothetical protein